MTDFVCLYNYEFGLSLCKIVRSSVILLLPLFIGFRFLYVNTNPSKNHTAPFRILLDVTSIATKREIQQTLNINEIVHLIVYCFSLFLCRPNNLSLVCLYLSLYISFLLFGHFFVNHFYAKLVRPITFLSFVIGQWYFVCGCMTIRRCVAYRNDLRGTLTFDLKVK